MIQGIGMLVQRNNMLTQCSRNMINTQPWLRLG